MVFPADDHGVISKGLWALVLLAFLGTARCYNADLAGAVGGLPIVGAIVQPPQAPRRRSVRQAQMFRRVIC